MLPAITWIGRRAVSLQQLSFFSELLYSGDVILLMWFHLVICHTRFVVVRRVARGRGHG